MFEWSELGLAVVEDQDEAYTRGHHTMTARIAKLTAALECLNIRVGPVWSSLMIGKLCEIHEEV